MIAIPSQLTILPWPILRLITTNLITIYPGAPVTVFAGNAFRFRFCHKSPFLSLTMIANRNNVTIKCFIINLLSLFFSVTSLSFLPPGLSFTLIEWKTGPPSICWKGPVARTLRGFPFNPINGLCLVMSRFPYPLPWKQQIRFSPKVFDIHCEVLISAVK